MSFVTRAVLFGEVGGFFQILRDYLFKFGLRETVMTKDPEHIKDLLERGQWPLVFVDVHETTGQDSFVVFDKLYSFPGFELVPFLLIGPDDDRRYLVHAQSVGARGSVKRPLQPLETKNLLEGIIPQKNDPWIEAAIEISRRMFQKNWEGARSGFAKLAGNPVFERYAEIGLLRCETQMGQYAKVEERITRLLKKYKGDQRILVEAADYFRYSSQSYTALKILRLVSAQKVLVQRMWQEACLSIDLDELDNAALVLGEMFKNESLREVATDGFVHLMLFMGLGEHVPALVRSFPNLSRDYMDFAHKTGRVPV